MEEGIYYLYIQCKYRTFNFGVKTGSGDNTYLICYHFFVTSPLCKVDRNCLQNRQLRKRLWSRSGLTFISFFFYHQPLFASIIRDVNNFAA